MPEVLCMLTDTSKGKEGGQWWGQFGGRFWVATRHTKIFIPFPIPKGSSILGHYQLNSWHESKKMHRTLNKYCYLSLLGHLIACPHLMLCAPGRIGPKSFMVRLFKGLFPSRVNILCTHTTLLWQPQRYGFPKEAECNLATLTFSSCNFDFERE